LFVNVTEARRTLLGGGESHEKEIEREMVVTCPFEFQKLMIFLFFFYQKNNIIITIFVSSIFLLVKNNK
jgi:hypothetical protein